MPNTITNFLENGIYNIKVNGEFHQITLDEIKSLKEKVEKSMISKLNGYHHNRYHNKTKLEKLHVCDKCVKWVPIDGSHKCIDELGDRYAKYIKTYRKYTKKNAKDLEDRYEKPVMGKEEVKEARAVLAKIKYIDTYNNKTTCECGGEYNVFTKTHHMKTKSHIQFTEHN